MRGVAVRGREYFFGKNGQQMTPLDSAEITNRNFKVCSCGAVWHERTDLLEDPAITFVGYQVHFKKLELGLFLFTHHACGTTLALRTQLFRDLYSGPVFTECLTGGEGCPEYCLREEEVRACPQKCECAYVREIMQIIREWPKKE